MHALAIAMKEKGHQVTGSDDAIYGVSRDNLDHAGLLPEEAGWHPEKIHAEIDSVVLGMHARKDNPELAKALDVIPSLPGRNTFSASAREEFITSFQTRRRRRVVHPLKTSTAYQGHRFGRQFWIWCIRSGQ